MKTRIALISSLLLGVAMATAKSAPPAPKPAVKTEVPTTVSRAEFESRLAQLQQAHDQMLAQLHALEGAEQEVQHWIQLLTPPPPKQVLNPAKPAK